MEALGFEPGDYASARECAVWPDCWRAVQFFARIGMGCWAFRGHDAMGLRYESLRDIRLAMKVTAREWAEGLFDDVQTIEDAAVEAMRGAQ